MFRATFCPKHVELILEINNLLLLHLVDFFYIILLTLMMHGQTPIKFTSYVFYSESSRNVKMFTENKKKHQPNATQFNKWQSTLQRVSIRREWSSDISYKTFRTHEFLCSECSKVEYHLLKCVAFRWRISILVLSAHHNKLTLPHSTSYPFFRLV